MKNCLVLHNACIYTQNTEQPVVTGLVIDRDHILAAGDERTLLQEFDQSARAQDMGGRTILPGLTDAHFHLECYALGLQYVDCETPTRAECLERVAERTRSTPPGQWIRGHGWNQNVWPEGFGNTAHLDAIAPNNPVYLTAKSLHAAWANTAALKLTGITPQTPDLEGGHFCRADNGSLTGILLESAMEAVEAAIPEPTMEEIVQAIREAQPRLWRMGLTGLHDFDQRRCFVALQTLHELGQLALRVVKSIPLHLLPQAVALGLRSGFGDDFLRIGSVKLFADGALGPQTAAMLAPYEGNQDGLGMLLLDAEGLVEHGRLAVENGLSLAVHAIGDRANHEMLNGYQQLRQYEMTLGGSRPYLRHRIEHVQLLHPQDAGRLAELGIIASMQPIHATSDMLMADRYWGKRANLSYAWRDQLQRGAHLAFGSDAPVESPNPFWGLHAAVTRRRQDGSPGVDGWYPEQRLTLAEALQGFTTGPAYAAGLDDRLGKLAPGYLADLIVLDKDPFEIDPQNLYTLQPQAVMLNGEWVVPL